MKNQKRALPIVLMVSFLMLVLMYTTSGLSSKTEIKNYNQVMEILDKEDVKSISITPQDGILVVNGKVRLKNNNDAIKSKNFTGNIPNSQTKIDSITELVKDRYIALTFNPEANSTILEIVSGLVFPLVMLGALMYMLSRSTGAAKGLDFGKNKARLDNGEKKITMDDVAGVDEEKQELMELVDYLKRPNKYLQMGARIPKGVLLVGPPGTGKTLLARAVAGEANVPFYTISGSDFVELFVGVGASRVREMFKEAKQTAPCIIFIDEIDAVGRQRGAGVGGGNDEREQTLNQLLVEMDGFSENSGIIMIAATNRPDVLDPAILRPGRFDRQIEISPPDKKGRIEILKVHARNKKLASDITYDYLAERTPGFTGADLENVLNEAALLAVRNDSKVIQMHDIDEAIDRIIGGPAKLTKKHQKDEKEMVAYHEAGHAVAGLVLEDAEVVQKVTIIPRGRAGGYVLMTPKEEKFLQTRKELTSRIIGLLSGRVAEELKFADISTGAHNDIEKSTRLARSMVTEFGMSDLGPIQYEQPQGSVFLGRDYNNKQNFSDQVAFDIDKEVKKIIDACYAQSQKMLKKYEPLHDLIAKTLLEKETLTKEEIYSLYEKGRLPENGENKKEYDETEEN